MVILPVPAPRKPKEATDAVDRVPTGVDVMAIAVPSAKFSLSAVEI